MHYKLLFPSLYLCAADLRGQDVDLTIRRVVVQDIQAAGGASEKKPVMYFEETKKKAEDKGEKEKCLVLNKTNAATIAKVLSDPEIDNWIGERITLYPTRAMAFGEEVDCVRVRAASKEN